MTKKGIDEKGGVCYINNNKSKRSFAFEQFGEAVCFKKQVRGCEKILIKKGGKV